MLLLDRAPHWVERDEILRVGGAQGDRRVRDWRKLGWPIEIAQRTPGMPWDYRLNLSPDDIG